jgi:hypothetical protein
MQFHQDIPVSVHYHQEVNVHQLVSSFRDHHLHRSLKQRLSQNCLPSVVIVVHIIHYLSYCRHFGFTNLLAAQEGKRGVDCKGEEHEVVLVWSVNSGKRRVFWNKTNITHLFRDERNTEHVDIEWKSRSGETFQISAYKAGIGVAPQYDLLIDRVSIFSLSHLSDLDPVENTMRVHPTTSATIVRSESFSDERSVGECSMECDDNYLDNLGAGFRLSMVGLKPSSRFDSSCQHVDDLMDDLPSTPFTDVLESLRQRITTIIPSSSDMVSRAIVKALSDDIYESSSCSSSLGSYSGSVHHSAMQIAAEAVWDTTEWINLNVQFAPRTDVMEQKREFLRRQMVSMFTHAHQERLDEHAAARVLSDVATLLGLPVRIPIPKDTLILKDLDKSTNSKSLLGSLMIYGDIQEVGMPPNGQRFAICRFASEQGPLGVLSAAEHGFLLINGKRPHVTLLEIPLVSIPSSMAQRANSAPHVLTKPIPMPSLVRRKSHQRNTIHIGTLISETPFLRLVNDPAIVSPGEGELSSFVRPNAFETITDQVPSMDVSSAVAVVSPPSNSLISPFAMEY